MMLTAMLQAGNLSGLLQWTAASTPVFAPGDDMTRARTGQGARVLLVEDDHLVAMHVEFALLDAGFDVVGVATTAEEAVSLARAQKPEVVVMDIRLAGARDGVDAALELFREFGLRSIFASAHHDPRTKLRAEPARPLGWLSKPYQPDMLIDALREALRQQD